MRSNIDNNMRVIIFHQSSMRIVYQTLTLILFYNGILNKLIINLKELLKRWPNSKYISIEIDNYINSSNPILPGSYGLPKIHKKGLPLRIIVSSSRSPLHNLATYLQRILQDIVYRFHLVT